MSSSAQDHWLFRRWRTPTEAVALGLATCAPTEGTGGSEAKTWDRDGKLVADDQFEADGSRKIKR